MRISLFILFIAVVISSCDKTPEQEENLLRNDSISMGAGYANDVFYSLENGMVKTAPRTEWDLAFSTDPFSSSILINEGSNVELYTYPSGDLSDWDNVDTTGMSAWAPMYNSDTSWYNAAFDRNALGHPDYGWGVYNMNTHSVVGDSIYVIKTTEGNYLKLAIEQRDGTTSNYSIKYNDFESADQTKEIVSSEYKDRNFIYYSFATHAVVDHEPADSTWDFVFTKYHDESIPYVVTGVLSNMDLEVAEVRDTPTDTATPDGAEFTTDISVIGSDWKSFDMEAFAYVMVPDLTYFIKKNETDIYKLIFTGTDGSASGKMVFSVEKLD